MQIELKKIQKKLGITFIYVTHDQDEALTMSDRIAIINKGVIEQLDTPQNIYNNPKTTFVADFIGESNILPGTITKTKKDTTEVKINKEITISIPSNEKDEIGNKINILIRPENIKVSTNILKDSIKGIVKDIIYDGAINKLFIELDEELSLKVNIQDEINFKEGSTVYLKIEKNNIVPIRGKKNEG